MMTGTTAKHLAIRAVLPPSLHTYLLRYNSRDRESGGFIHSRIYLLHFSFQTLYNFNTTIISEESLLLGNISKRDWRTVSKDEIQFFVGGVHNGNRQ